MSRLWKSSKFWVAVIDAVSSTLAIVLAWFLAPDKVNQVLILIGIWQPIMIAVIIGTWVEDAAAKGNLAVYDKQVQEKIDEYMPAHKTNINRQGDV